MGDLADLATLATWSAGLGADYVLVNPLHAAEPLPPLEPSPYLPSSRRFFNPLYLRVEDIPEYAAIRAGHRRPAARSSGRARRSDLDRDAAWSAKRAALLLVHAAPRAPERQAAYEAFREREGDALLQFATWSVLAEDHGNDAREWPEELHDAHGAAAWRSTRRPTPTGSTSTEWLQWVLDEQLEQAQAKAVAAGMRLGTMHDLAVGVHPGGADAWRMPRRLRRRRPGSARRRTPTTSSARTGASRPGAPTGSPSSPTSRSAT